MKSFKRRLAIVLAFVMVVLCAVPAMAAPERDHWGYVHFSGAESGTSVNYNNKAHTIGNNGYTDDTFYGTKTELKDDILFPDDDYEVESVSWSTSGRFDHWEVTVKEITRFTVTYEVDGKAVASESVVAGDYAEGYDYAEDEESTLRHFAYWYKGDLANKFEVASNSITENITLNAAFEYDTIVYLNNTVTGEVASKSFCPGEVFYQPNESQKDFYANGTEYHTEGGTEYYKFLRWVNDRGREYTFGGEAESGIYNGNKKINLYSIWQKNYVVKFVGARGESEKFSPVDYFGYAERPDAPVPSENIGYDFVGGFVGETNYEQYGIFSVFDRKWHIAGGITVNGVYTPKTYTVNYDATEHGTITGESSFQIKYGEELYGKVTDVIPESGYTRTGWKTESGTILPLDATISTAYFTEDELRANAEGNYIINLTATYTAPEPKPEPIHTGGGSAKSSQPAGTVTGTWTYIATADKWTFTSNEGKVYYNEWAYIYNPYATGTQPKASWYFFDANGIMLTGYQWIPSLAGGYRLFYFHEAADGDRGRMYANQATPNGGVADANGWVSINGVLQVK